MDGFAAFRLDTDGLDTHTSHEQQKCENECAMYFASPDLFPPAEAGVLFNSEGETKLVRERHVAYLLGGLESLPHYFDGLDASRPWICYWIVHALDLLDAFPTNYIPRIVDTLGRCQSKAGGFGGGPQQLPHSAPTYAAVLSLCVCGTEEAYRVVDRPALYRFFMSLKDRSGGFMVHRDGETDIRGTYTVLAVADLCNVLTPELVEGTADFVRSCQRYEGGFAGEPGGEAHGGYAFCGAAALTILNQLHTCDMPGFIAWLTARQMRLEGGYQGRTNKLVDGCYSFWQGGAVALLPRAKRAKPAAPAVASASGGGGAAPSSAGAVGTGAGAGAGAGGAGGDVTAEADVDMAQGEGADSCGAADDSDGDDGDYDPEELLMDTERLQRYILRCCQRVDGGLRDKPSKPRDFYHTCYCLSGLSVAQRTRSGAVGTVWGDDGNLLEPLDARYNLRRKRVLMARAYFMRQPCSHEAFMGTSGRTDAPAASSDTAPLTLPSDDVVMEVGASDTDAGAGACAGASGSGAAAVDAAMPRGAAPAPVVHAPHMPAGAAAVTWVAPPSSLRAGAHGTAAAASAGGSGSMAPTAAPGEHVPRAPPQPR